MSNNNFAPFFLVEHEDSCSVCLNAGDFGAHIFETREEEGFEGSGYDWASLAEVFLNEVTSNFKGIVKFDPEGSMFCAYSDNKEALIEFITAFKKACENEELIQDLFSRAELD